MSGEARLREDICRMGEMLSRRGLAHGSSGNISVRLDDGILVTPTNSSLGLLEPEAIAKVAADGAHLSGDKPSKEALLHLAFHAAQPERHAVVHLHSTHCVALSCLRHGGNAEVLPPLTAYYAMRIGRLPLLPYFRPGDPRLAEAVGAAAQSHHAMLLANHGPVVGGRDLRDAVFNAEEVEETARLFFLLGDRDVKPLDAEQLAELARFFPS